jgi:alanine racemase
MHAPIVEIDIPALQHNFAQVKQYAPKSKVLAMIKANAYGHGAIACAKNLPDADAFGVARLDEAILLRQAGIQQPLVLLGGVLYANELDIIAEYDFDILVHQPDQIAMLEAYKGAHKFSVWLKLDTGLHRLGFSAEQATDAYLKLKNCKQVKQPFYVMSHLSAPEQEGSPLTLQQLDKFQELTEHWPEEKSMAKSAGIIAWPQTHFDWVRPGIMLYGISPFPGKTGEDLNLKPVMTVRSHLLRVDQRKAGDPIGYGGTWRCPEDMPVGVVAMGYADGYPGNLREPAPILLNDQICTVVGRVAMDLLMVDLRQKPDAKAGDEVVLWGKGLPVEKVAHAAQSVPYTLTTAISFRASRILLTGSQTQQQYA